MRIAIIGDIHANMYALQSALESIVKKKVDCILCTGDVVGYMMYPNEVIALLQKYNVHCVLGNHDENVLKQNEITKEEFKKLDIQTVQKSASIVYTTHVLKQKSKEYLQQLPKTYTVKHNAHILKVCHGSFERIDEYVYEDSESLQTIVKQEEVSILVFGHTHVPFIKQVGQSLCINPGSCGKPKAGSCDPTYIIVDMDDQIVCELHTFKYPYEKMVEDIKNNPYIANGLVEMLMEGK